MLLLHRSISAMLLSVISLFCIPAIAQNTHQSTEELNQKTNEQEDPTDTKSQLPPKGDWPEPVMNLTFGTLIIEQLENRYNGGFNTFVWDAQGWYGGDYNRFWFKTEGEVETKGDSQGETELQFLYSRLIVPFWDFQAGLRVDQAWGSGSNPSREFLVVGVQGLAPYRFEVEPTLFLSEDGDISARLTASTDLLITQKLIIQPRIETEVAAQKVEKYGVGEGLNYVDFGLRLRYEIKREFAPYVGINYIEEFGETATISRSEGSDVRNFSAIAGVRLWF